MPKLLIKGHSERPQKPRFLWRLRVASLVLLGLIGLGVLIALNSAYNIGALLIAVGVLGQLFLAQLRDQMEKSFREERAARADFESDRNYELLLEEQRIKKVELYLKLNPKLSREEREFLMQNLLPDSTDKTE